MGIISLIIAILGFALLFKVSAILGFIVYLVAFILSLHTLKSKVGYEDTFSIFKFIKNINKENFLSEGIHTVIVACIPLVTIIGLYQWIYVDTFRFVNSLF